MLRDRKRVSRSSSDDAKYDEILAVEELPAELQAAFEQDPIVLPAWDPMGSLACPR